MKREIVFAICAIFLTSNYIMAGKYSDKDVEKLLKRVEQLEKSVKKFQGDYEEQIDELNARVDDNEFQASLNRIKWGGEFESTVGNYWGRQGSIKGIYTGSKYNNHNKWDLKLRLNMQTNINERTKFIGRLSMYKGWASSQKWGGMNGYPGTFDSSDGRSLGGSSIYVERAYVDYKITNNLIATIGRQPSNDGPGMNLKNNTPRKSTYPSILFNGNADGLVLSYKFPKKTISNGAIRLAYGKGYQWSDDSYGYNANQNDLKDLNVYGAFLEGSLPFKKMGSNLVVFSAVLGKDFVGSSGDSNTSHNINLGDFKHFGLYFENNRAFGTKLNYFISLAMSNPKSNGKSYITAMGPMQLLKKDGYAYHVGARYDINSKFKIGYEFNHGSRYWFSYTTGSYDPLNKIATRGSAHDFYLMYQMDMNQFLRMGYTSIDYKYAMSGWHMAPNGKPMPTDDYARLLYLNYNVKF